MIGHEDGRSISAVEPVGMKVSIVSGSWPPDRCGVGDYARQLADALQARAVTVTRLGGESWSGHRIFLGVREAAGRQGCDLLHLQYPTMGFGRSLVPALLPLLAGDTPFVVSLHEFSSLRRVRRPWFASFAHRADLRIFTNDDERAAFKAIMRPTRGDDIVIPIGSNIPDGRAQVRLPRSICYFGLITPGKGLESFLELASRAAGYGWRLSLIGAVPPTYDTYARAIIDRARQLGVSLFLNRSEADVADLLSAQEVAYLPFPHGVTITRGSLLAAMRNGAVVVTTHVETTSDVLRRMTVHASNAAEAGIKIAELFDDDIARGTLREAAAAIPLSWDRIADAHLTAYTALMAYRRARGRLRRSASHVARA